MKMKLLTRFQNVLIVSSSLFMLGGCTGIRKEDFASGSLARGPLSVQLHGSVTDDGLPNSPANLTHHWEFVSGPDTVNFEDATDLNTQATFSMPGIYILRLVAGDGSLESHDDVKIELKSK
jgi:hypothetical protein